MLVTTRRHDAPVPGAGRAVVDVGTCTRAESLAHLRERLAAVGKAHLLDDRTEELIEALGRLPPALVHAAAHLINEDTDSTGYLRLFIDRASRMDAPLLPGTDTDDYGRPVTASLLLLLDAARQREPAGLATPAVRLAAHLDPAGHPQQLWATAAVTRYLDAHRTPQSAPVTAGWTSSVASRWKWVQAGWWRR
ncbi:hypothetical protein [Kitasatospora sp. CB02891]|uniref:hypothetical protein n=1 Tax=Kitasatospora sp. CB02891 TaxID=2020329 RepID=UPI000C2723F7|nr:hypothetical protein [Kitasatospora sp. CB02891]PJN29157.1 hypothetical protein CG736_00875 [Kitasatospora sp. CB02891]